MAITFVTKYPTALKNSTWQTKKSFKDKTKAKTKTGLGAALALAEKDWGKIDFDRMIASKQDLGDTLNERQTALRAATDYKNGQVVAKAIASLEAAHTKAVATGNNTALTTNASNAAKALATALDTQADYLRHISLADFQAKTAGLNQIVNQLEKDHLEALRSMDRIRSDFDRAQDASVWTNSNVGTVIADAMQTTQKLFEQTADQTWRTNHDRWRALQGHYNATNTRIQRNPGARAVEEIKEFPNLIQDSLGNMWQ